MNDCQNRLRELGNRVAALMLWGASGPGDSPDARLHFWSEYFACYDEMVSLKKEHPELPELPRCIVPADEAEKIRRAIGGLCS